MSFVSLSRSTHDIMMMNRNGTWGFSLNQRPTRSFIVVILIIVVADVVVVIVVEILLLVEIGMLIGPALSPMRIDRMTLAGVLRLMLLVIGRLLMIAFLIVLQKLLILLRHVPIVGRQVFRHFVVRGVVGGDGSAAILEASFLFRFLKAHATFAGFAIVADFVFKHVKVAGIFIVLFGFRTNVVHHVSFILVVVPVIIFPTPRFRHAVFITIPRRGGGLSHTLGLIGEHQKGKKARNGVPRTGRDLTLVFLTKIPAPHEHGKGHANGGPNIGPHDPPFHGGRRKLKTVRTNKHGPSHQSQGTAQKGQIPGRFHVEIGNVLVLVPGVQDAGLVRGHVGGFTQIGGQFARNQTVPVTGAGNHVARDGVEFGNALKEATHDDVQAHEQATKSTHHGHYGVTTSVRTAATSRPGTSRCHATKPTVIAPSLAKLDATLGGAHGWLVGWL
mmetsp:Transcript_3680/g.9212  ORF Transcript_3680/g.9212 Transcript_3680/m.9212 type:complete len:444 (-) Transcript_3680:270-1601(-)